MEIVQILVILIQAAPWNPNVMNGDMAAHLTRSIKTFGFLVPLVVREMTNGLYETVGGAQRLTAMETLGYEEAPCVVVTADDAQARLLSQALNRIQGEDDLGLRAELVREVLKDIPEEEVLGLLPESAASLKALANLGQEDMAEQIQAWDKAQAAKLKHVQFQLLPFQLEVVEEALAMVQPQAKEAQGNNPNTRGTALYLLCSKLLELKEESK